MTYAMATANKVSAVIGPVVYGVVLTSLDALRPDPIRNVFKSPAHLTLVVGALPIRSYHRPSCVIE